MKFLFAVFLVGIIGFVAAKDQFWDAEESQEWANLPEKVDDRVNDVDGALDEFWDAEEFQSPSVVTDDVNDD